VSVPPAARRAAEDPPRRSALGAALRGAAAGAAGGLAMMATRPLAERAVSAPPAAREPEWERVVRTQAKRVDAPLSKREIQHTGAVAHLAYAALWGALYGAVQNALRLPAPAHGALFGTVVYAANFPRWGLMPRLGVLPPTGRQHPRFAALPMATHAAYGVVTAQAYALLSRRDGDGEG
jgi:hypothetical protein